MLSTQTEQKNKQDKLLLENNKACKIDSNPTNPITSYLPSTGARETVAFLYFIQH